jgi:malate dehydrogenase
MAPIKVVITGAAGQIGYALLPRIALGDMFGKDTPVSLVLFDIPPALEAMRGVALELEDMASPILADVSVTDQVDVAFAGVDVCVMLGAFPRKPGMERKDLLERNVAIFATQGKALAQHAKKTVKVLVVGNPANTNAAIAAAAAGDALPASAWSCLTRLDHNRATSQLALKAGVAPSEVKNVAVWGNHSSTQFPDAAHATIAGKAAAGVIGDDAWLTGDFITTVQKRGAAIVEARKLSSAMSAANAIVDHMRDWTAGTSGDAWVSMGLVVPASSPYGVTPGLVYSFPVRCSNGEAKIVEGLDISEFARERMTVTENELKEEKEIALQLLAEKK